MAYDNLIYEWLIWNKIIGIELDWVSITSGLTKICKAKYYETTNIDILSIY